MRPENRTTFVVAILFTLLVFIGLAANGSARADPPVRAARIAYITGNVSFAQAGDNRWVQAAINWPLTIGDRLWTDRGARVEIQVGGAVLRMGENTSFALLNLDGNVAQIRLDEGTLNVRARRFGPRQYVEVATPNLAFTVRQAGSYRIQVDADGDATAIIVRSGRGEVYGERASYVVDSRQSYRFGGTGLRSYERYSAPAPDPFDRWASDRDRRLDASISARYVSPDVVGYEDLDAHGTWRSEPEYGRVWVPSRVSNDWTPYRDGHWAWVAPWGWTWVDDAPWGYAVSHYGRWANTRGSWVWVPAPVQSRAVYAPALVAFVGGSNFQITLSSGGAGVAWFPLGPREVYRPPYQVSRGYFENVNRSNTNVSPATITNVYNNVNVTNVYMNRRVRNAVVAVPATAFAQSQPIARAAVAPPQQVAASAPVTTAPQVRPERGAGRAAERPERAERARERRVIVRNAPPPAAAAPATQAPAGAAAAKPAAPAPAANVTVVAPQQAAAPKAAPPAAAPEGKPAAAAERKGDDRKGGERRAEDRKGEDRKPPAAAAAPSAPAPAPAPAPVAKPAPAATPAPAAPAPAAAQKAAPPQAKPPQAERKGDERKGGDRRAEDRKGEDRKPPAAAVAPGAPAPAPTPAPVAKPAPAATPAPAAPAPAAVQKAAPPADRSAERKADEDRKGRERRAEDRKGEDRKPPAAAAPTPAPVAKPAPAATPAAPPPAAAQKAAAPPVAVAPPAPKPAAAPPAPAPAKAEPAPVTKAPAETAKQREDRKREGRRDKKDDDKKDDDKK